MYMIMNIYKTQIKGRKRRIGFGKKGKNSFTVHRSEEVLPGEMRCGVLSRGSSASSDGEGSVDVDRFESTFHGKFHYFSFIAFAFCFLFSSFIQFYFFF